MKFKNLWRIYLIVIILSFFSTICAIAIFIHSASADHNTLDNLITFVVTILSMLIAILAYHISVKTYISIDAVNAISRMDGNVMENENYRTNIASIIRHFNAQKREDTCNQIMSHIENLFENNSITSGAKLADSIQEMIDIIVLFSFVIKKDNHIGQNDNINIRIERLIKKIEKKVAEFEQLSEGSCILIHESVKLLKAVYTYQCYKAGFQTHTNISLLLDVRGAMLKNAISRTVYYNYIGLLYLNKATQALNKHLLSHSATIDILSIDAAKILKETSCQEDKELASIYIDESESNFNKALLSISDELMWNAFIQYNKARTQYIRSLLSDINSQTWETTMQTAIAYRTKLVTIIEDILDGENTSYFQRAFNDQLKMAQMMYIRLQIASGTKYKTTPTLPDIGDDEFLRLKNIQKDILSHIPRP